MTNPNDPAFKDIEHMSSGGHVHSNCFQNLTKREYFAAMAMQGYISSSRDHMHVWAVKDADALIAELNKKEPQ